MYKLSPSDFRYLWEDCKHCYYRKVKYGVNLPSIGIPGVFNKMNSLLQGTIVGMRLEEVNPSLPSGVIEVKEGFLKSVPIPSSHCFISGRFDILSKLDDGTFAVIDFKISDPTQEKVQKFTHQLHAYKFALENPADGQPARKISQIGVVVVSPETISFNGGHIVFKSKPNWFELHEDMNSFYNFIREVDSVLAGKLPETTENCQWCRYRVQ